MQVRVKGSMCLVDVDWRPDAVVDVVVRLLGDLAIHVDKLANAALVAGVADDDAVVRAGEAFKLTSGLDDLYLKPRGTR